MSGEERHRAVYAAFASAWSQRNLDALLSYVTEDIVYGASVGDEPGQTYRGKRAVRAGFETIMAHDRAGVMVPGRSVFQGNLGYAEWTSQSSHGDVRGIDVLVFRDGLIAVKDAYRKCRG